MSKVHFVGAFGAGMSALAQFHAMGGGSATGSDRFMDQGRAGDIRTRLERAGVSLFAQDGGGIDAKTETVVVSTAIEDDNPDLAAARRLSIPVVHRADWLARLVREHRTIAVAGTSGKSTVSAMTYSILTEAGMSPSVITGAGLHALEEQGLLGNAKRGESRWLIIEAGESDGTLPKYEPEIGVLLNLGKDHKELDELEAIFESFRGRCARFILDADEANLSRWSSGAVSYGFSAGALRGENLEVGSAHSRFSVEGVVFEIPLPGRYNAVNALAAVCSAREAGAPLDAAARALAAYRGIARRYDEIGGARGVRVIDDYAHNPDKIRAVLAAARRQANGGGLRVVFQPHGFGPTRFLKHELIEAFASGLGKADTLWIVPIFYAGGTAAKDIDSAMLTNPLRTRGMDARAPATREAALEEIADASQDGDVILVLGARDPSLTDFSKAVLASLNK